MSTVEEGGNIVGPVPVHLFTKSFGNVRDRQDPGLRIIGSIRSCAYSSNLDTLSEGAEPRHKIRVLLKLDFEFIPGYRSSHEDVTMSLTFSDNIVAGFDATDDGENACLDLVQHRTDAENAHRQLDIHLDDVYQPLLKSRGEMSDHTPFVVYRDHKKPSEVLLIRIPGGLRQPASDPVTLRLAVLVGVPPASFNILLETDTVYGVRGRIERGKIDYGTEHDTQYVNVLQVDSIASLANVRGRQIPVGHAGPEKEAAATPKPPLHDSPPFGFVEEVEDTSRISHAQDPEANPHGGQQASSGKPINPDQTERLEMDQSDIPAVHRPASPRPRRRTTTERLGLPATFHIPSEASGPGRPPVQQEPEHQDGPSMDAFGRVAFCLFVEDAIKIGMAATSVPSITEPSTVDLATQVVKKVKILGRTLSVCEALRALCASEQHSRLFVRHSEGRERIYAAIWHAVREETGSTEFL